MGAATSLMYNPEDAPLPIGAMVLDSGFSGLKKIVEGIAAQQNLPEQLV